MSSPSVSLVLCTCPNDDTAETLARQVVERQLAACVNRIPDIGSVYRWAGKVETASEALLLIKTTSAIYGELEDFLLSNHPYKCPEIIRIDVDSGSKSYLNWVLENTGNL